MYRIIPVGSYKYQIVSLASGVAFTVASAAEAVRYVAKQRGTIVKERN